MRCTLVSTLYDTSFFVFTIANHFLYCTEAVRILDFQELIDIATKFPVDPVFEDDDNISDDSRAKMDVGQVTEPGEREAAMSTTPHDVPIRHSAPPQSTKTLEGSYHSSLPSDVHDAPRPTSSDVWAGAISRLQTQVSLNTSMLESQRQKVQDIETGMHRLHNEIGNIVTAVHEIQAELRAKSSSAADTHHDSGDLDVLVGQVEAATNKANEVDSLKLQLELMKNRMKRLEDQGSPAIAAHRPRTSSTHRDSPFHEVPPPPPPVGIRHQPPKPTYHQPLPPMRTASMASPVDSRPAGFPHPPHALHAPIPESQGVLSHHAGPEARQFSNESSTTMQASSSSSFRPPEPLPPPSTLSSWRPADTMPHPGGLPPPPPPPGPARPHAMEPEPHSTGWAAVNTAQTSKRPYEEPRQSPYGSPRTGSPKRPKLAPIMPRSTYSDESSLVPSSVTQSGPTESPFTSRSRAPSDGSQSQSQTLPTPSSASIPGHRFIVSTAQADSQESWRPESERMMHFHHHHGHGPHGQHGPHGHGRVRGRGRARGPRRRGGLANPMQSLNLGTPEWEKPGWTGSQVSPNGFYQPLGHHSPETAERGGLVRGSGGVAGGPTDRETEFPATPLAVQGPYDPFAAGNPEGGAGHQGSGGKKTRTKPIRNAEGVLIRKDGRPDMRSVSSANNLRKVHAKKEAERAENDGRTPTSARSLAPAGSNSMSPEDDNGSPSPGTPPEGGEGRVEEQDTQERHQELMNRIFPHGVDSGGRSAAERFFPRHDQQEVSEGVTSTEQESEERREGESHDVQRETGSQMTDVVMREMSEAQTEAHQEQRGEQQDTNMPTLDEANEEQETGQQVRSE